MATEEENAQTRMGDDPPMKTIFKQALGPFSSLFVGAAYGIVDSYWVSKALGESAISAMGASYIYDTINYSFALYLSACAGAKLGFMYGMGNKEHCAQIVIDLMRFSVILSIIIPLVLLPTAKMYARWIGSTEQVANNVYLYLLPGCSLTIITQLYLILCGVLQAEGRSFLYGSMQICSMLLNMLVLDPLLLLYFKTGIWGASLASVFSSLVPLIVLMVMLFSGKLEVKPTLSLFFNSFSPEFGSSLKIGLTSLVIYISNAVPVFLLMKLILNRAIVWGVTNEVLSGLNILLKVYYVVISVDTALGQALLPTGAFAFGSNDKSRFKWLAIHAFWMGTLWNAIISSIIIIFARSISKIWLADETFIQWGTKYLRFGHYSVVLIMLRLVVTICFQASLNTKHALTIGLLTQLVPVPLFAIPMFYLDKTKNPDNLLYTYVFTPIFSFIASLIYLMFMKRKLFAEEVSAEAQIP